MWMGTMTIDGKKEPYITKVKADFERTIFCHGGDILGKQDYVQCIAKTADAAIAECMKWRT